MSASADQDPCKRWKNLLIDLANNPDNAELTKLSTDQLRPILAHLDECDVCSGDDVFEEVFNKFPPNTMAEKMVLAAEVIADLFGKIEGTDEADDGDGTDDDLIVERKLGLVDFSTD